MGFSDNYIYICMCVCARAPLQLCDLAMTQFSINLGKHVMAFTNVTQLKEAQHRTSLNLLRVRHGKM